MGNKGPGYVTRLVFLNDRHTQSSQGLQEMAAESAIPSVLGSVTWCVLLISDTGYWYGNNRPLDRRMAGLWSVGGQKEANLVDKTSSTVDEEGEALIESCQSHSSRLIKTLNSPPPRHVRVYLMVDCSPGINERQDVPFYDFACFRSRRCTEEIPNLYVPRFRGRGRKVPGKQDNKLKKDMTSQLFIERRVV